MRRFARSAVVAGFALTASVLASCGTTPDTGIRLEVSAMLAEGQSLDRVHVRTYDTTDSRLATIDEHDFSISISSTTVPFSMSIVPRDASHPNMHLGIEVIGYVSTGATVMAHVHTAFIPGRIFVVPVVLRDCMPPCTGLETCSENHSCDEAVFVEPTTFPAYGVDAANDTGTPRDDIVDVADTGPPPMDVVDTGPPPTDAEDIVDASDVIDVPDAMDAMDVVDVPIAMDTVDVVDATDAMDAVDAPDVMDAIDAVDTTDVVAAPDIVDTPPPPPDVMRLACGGSGFYCPATEGMWVCAPPPPGQMQQQCCFPYGGVPSCAGITCAVAGYTCNIDPRGNAACCGPPQP